MANEAEGEGDEVVLEDKNKGVEEVIESQNAARVTPLRPRWLSKER